ncbi:MAG TPA: IS1595 family transposase, partial [Candidatus Binatia bacterium]|nr:IS1595 family transposase [Candidatus Binatia bacterium]
MKIQVPETMLEAARKFADPQVAHDFWVALRWPNGVACPRCGLAEPHYLGDKYRRWFCSDCKRQFTAKVGTIFEDSPIGFDKWMPAIWLISSNRNGISSCELARAIGVTQKTAWFMLHRIRTALANDSFDQLRGIIETDETYVGGSYTSKPKRVRRNRTLASKRFENKTAVLGMVERGGRVRAMVLPTSTRRELLPRLRDHVHQDATVFTDANPSYRDLDEMFLRHDSVNHTLEEYVRGEVHTNTIENFWSVLKRMLGGTYIAVDAKHLAKYIEEEIFRYNERENTDGPRFVKA